ncbi:unnamed protein product [Alopecurus aequalis]
MGEPIDGASLGPTTGVLDSPGDLVGARTSEEGNAKVTKNVYKQHVLSEEEGKQQEEVEGEEEEDDDDQGGMAKEITKRGVFADLFKYHGCSWPKVVGLKVHKAKRIIRKGKPDIYFEVKRENQMLTMWYCSRRVRLIVDSSNCVVETPDVG